jgi:uncharacterized membrane protein
MQVGVGRGWWRLSDWVVLAGSAGAAGLSFYLLIESLGSNAYPPGCGAGSGCGQVLSSKYARLLGLPVSLFAGLLYLMTIVIWVFHRTQEGGGLFFPVILLAIGLSVYGAAGWFVYLQFFDLQAICPYCMVDHAFGVTAATAIMIAIRPWSLVQLLAGGLLGVGSVGALIGLQASSVQPLDFVGTDSGQPSPTLNSAEGATVSLPGDGMSLAIGEQPHLGPADAPQAIVIVYDYACPHCRHTHHVLGELQSQRADQLVLVQLPVSIHPDCNPAMQEVPARFDQSCELGRLALAVFLTDRAQFQAFDRWMFQTMAPRNLADARKMAEKLVDSQRLAENLEPADRMLRRNISIFTQSQAERVPVVIVPGHRPIEGRVEDVRQIAQLLDDSRKDETQAGE